jgi:hypothetical protein
MRLRLARRRAVDDVKSESMSSLLGLLLTKWRLRKGSLEAVGALRKA